MRSPDLEMLPLMLHFSPDDVSLATSLSLAPFPRCNGIRLTPEAQAPGLRSSLILNRERKPERARRKVQQIQRRLGNPDWRNTLYLAFPKPKGMWARTHAKLVREAGKSLQISEAPLLKFPRSVPKADIDQSRARRYGSFLCLLRVTIEPPFA